MDKLSHVVGGPIQQNFDQLVKQFGRVAPSEFQTSLPANPVDGEVIYYDTGTEGVVWQLRYNAGSASARKWEFVGGSPLEDEVSTLEATVATHTTYQNLTTAGPLVIAPLAGEYIISGGCYAQPASAVGTAALAAVKIGAAATLDADRVMQFSNQTAASQVSMGSRSMRKTLAAGDDIRLQYRAGTALASTFGFRWINVLPVRVG